MVFFGKGKTMRTNYAKLVVMAAMALLLVSTVVCRAGEKKEDFWGGDRPRQRYRDRQGRFELTEERIERIMARLKEAEPEKAEELQKLQEEDPNQFKAELRKTLRERFGKRLQERGQKGARQGRGAGPGPGGPGGHHGPSGHGGPPDIGGPMAGRMQGEHAELMEWLEKNYPEAAERMRDLHGDKPELFERRMGLGLRRYGRIMEAEKENPELAAVLKEDLELKEHRDKLLRQIRKATDEQEKKELVAELQAVVNARFDLIVKRKQMEYEELRKRLERLRQQVQKSEANVEKWKNADYKAENIKARVEKLLEGKQKFDWE